MIAYLDSSVVMGILLGQTPPPAQWEAIQRNVSSSLLVVECLRVLDRFRLTREMLADELEVRKTDLRILLRQIQLLPIDEATLNLAAQPMSISIRSLDAVHLATALRYRETHLRSETPLVVVTHDQRLARAARAFDFPVLGA